MSGVINALFGGQPQNLEYVGYTECPICGDDCAELWRDEVSGKEYTRCPFIGCDEWGKLVELRGEDDAQLRDYRASQIADAAERMLRGEGDTE